MSKWLFIFFFSLVTVMARAGAVDDAAKRGVLRVGLDPAYLPFEMTNKKGQIIGFEIDILKAMAKSMGVKLEIVSVGFDGLIPGLLTEKFDIISSGMTITQERNLKVNFSDPIAVTGQAVLLRKDLADKIKSYKELNDPQYKVTSKLGSTGETAVKKHLAKAQYFSYNQEANAVLEVVNGKADAFVYDSSYCILALKQLGNNQLVYLDTPITYEPQAIAMRKGDYDSINWINNFLRQIKHDGTYDRLYTKWFKKTDWLSEME